MKQHCAAGVIIEDPKGWLLCHPTNGGKSWDFPKGNVDPGEDHWVAALRELREETGIELDLETISLLDLGQHAYQDHRDLHLFYVRVNEVIDTKVLVCESMVNPPNGKPFPEMDRFAVFPKKRAIARIYPRVRKWIETNAAYILE